MLHLSPVDLFGPGPVKLVEGFNDGKACCGNPPSDAAVLPALAFAFNEPREVLQWSPLLTSGLGGEGLMVFLDKGQVEVGQLFCEAQFFVIHERGLGRKLSVGIVNGEVRFGQVQLEQVGCAGQVQGAGFGQVAQALLQDVGDVFATVGVILVRILNGPRDFVGAIDLDQSEDLLHVMAGVEPALLELLVVFGGLRARLKKRASNCCSRALVALNQKRPSVIGMFEVTVPFVGTDARRRVDPGDREPAGPRRSWAGRCPGQMRRDGVTIGLPQHTEATVDR